MRMHLWLCLIPALLVIHDLRANAQQPLTWEQVRERFERNNPQLLAGQMNVSESQANEITANLRPNPQLGVVLDQFRVFNPNPLSINTSQLTPTVTQLLERRSKRHLRFQSAQLATRGAEADQQDLERQLIFSLRNNFIQVLQAKSTLQLATDNLKYYDQVIQVNRERLKAGDIARIDLERVELQRAQFENDYQNASVNLRQAKLALLAFMNERQPLDGFDVTGEFDFHETLPTQQELRTAALDARPDLKSAVTAIERAKTDHKLAWANGSTDPTMGLEYQRTGPDNTMGINLGIPVRIFDRNQGEKTRTSYEITRAERIRENVVAGILRDVDSAQVTLASVETLLKPFRDRYIPQATDVRDTISFSYARGAASLLEFLDAQKSYRDIQLSYRNLIASYLNAVNQVNFTVGREVIP